MGTINLRLKNLKIDQALFIPAILKIMDTKHSNTQFQCKDCGREKELYFQVICVLCSEMTCDKCDSACCAHMCKDCAQECECIQKED
jgi:hypothetical protein